MASFLKYRQNKKTTATSIQETTVPPELQHISDSWDHHSELSDETHEKLHAAMGGPGKSFTTFPLVGQNHADVDADVAEHLTKHGYQVKDYTKGIASVKKQVGDPSKGIPMREKMVDEKIGSVLDKTGAHDDVKKAFVNDPARTSTKFTPGSSGHHVVITHGALGISGASTGTSWANQSCMDQGRSTDYNHKLEDDSQHGTHMAYLVHHDDVNAMKYGEPDKPIARIAIKPFHEHKDSHISDTIFRPENKTYGSGSSSFEKAVGNWSVNKYPAKAGVEYTKNSHVYDDTNNTKYKSVSKEDAEKSIKDSVSVVDTKGTSVDKDVIDHVMAHGKKHLEQFDPNNGTSHAYEKGLFVKNTSEIGNLNTQHVAALHHMASEVAEKSGAVMPMHELAVAHGDKMSTNAINKHMGTFGTTSATSRMLMNPKLPEHVVDNLPTSKYNQVRRSMLKPHHYDKVVNNYLDGGSGSSYDLNDHAAHLSKEHIDKLANINMASATARGGLHPQTKPPLNVIMNSSHFAQEHHDKLVSNIHSQGFASNSTAETHNILGSSKFSTIGDAEKLAPIGGLGTLSKNPQISTETQKAVKDKFISSAALGASKEHGGYYDVKGFGGSVHVPSQISKHMTPEDHKTLAESRKSVSFESPDHSEKHLNAIHTLVKKSDNELGDHIDKQTAHHEEHDLGEYDHTDGEDEHANHLVEKLHNHVANYARAIDSHIDHHVAEGSSSEEHTINHTHHEKVDAHLAHIDDLNNYKTHNNTYSSDTEHFDEHVADIHDRMAKIKENDEYRENNDHWD
jgi:hypothetical protein